MADQAVTLSAVSGAIIERLSAEQARQTGFTHRFKIPYSGINNSSWTGQGDTVTVTLGTTPTRFLIDKAAMIVTTAFATTGTLTAQVGTDGDPDNFIDAQSVTSAAVLIGSQGAEPVTEAGSFAAASDVLVVRFTTQAATGAPADITAGELEVLLGIIDLDDLI